MTPSQVGKFLESVARGWSITRACRSAGVELGAVYALRKRDAFFADRWFEAQEAGTDRFEDAVSDRALNGTTKGVWHQGQLVGYERVYSEKLLLAALAARRPKKWKMFEIEAGEAGGAPSVRGEDVLSILEQKLAGLETRSATFALEESSSSGDDA